MGVGSLNAMRPNTEADFWKRVSKLPADCWIWTARRDDSGYGTFTFSGKDCKAHRLAWTFSFGSIPHGLNVLHACDNPPCCNPQHLFLGTCADNNADRFAKGRYRVKLDADAVAEIRRTYVRRHPEFGGRPLARKFGVSDSLICMINNGERR